ncbi:MAG: MerR family transcriptional regulator [Desulfosarcina sp.]
MSEPVGRSIGYVSAQTGLSTHVLRAWERRYQAVTPQRTPTGRRLYASTDIDRLHLLKRLIQMGYSISRVAGMSVAELLKLAETDAKSAAGHRQPTPIAAASGSADCTAFVDQCLQAVSALDSRALRRSLGNASAAFSHQTLLESIIHPFMQQVGRHWSKGSFRIMHGNLASVVVEGFFSSILERHSNDPSARPCLLIATPAGQFCYLGALSVAVTAQDHGWEPLFMGANLPAEEIAAAQSVLETQMLALSITCRIDDGFMHRELSRLSDLLDDRCPIVVGGRANQMYRDCIEATGATICPTTRDLINQLY